MTHEEDLLSQCSKKAKEIGLDESIQIQHGPLDRLMQGESKFFVKAVPGSYGKAFIARHGFSSTLAGALEILLLDLARSDEDVLKVELQVLDEGARKKVLGAAQARHAALKAAPLIQDDLAWLRANQKVECTGSCYAEARCDAHEHWHEVRDRIIAELVRS